MPELDKSAPPQPDEVEAERRFRETLERLVSTPHKPHGDAKLGPNKAGAKPEKRR